MLNSAIIDAIQRRLKNDTKFSSADIIAEANIAQLQVAVDVNCLETSGTDVTLTNLQEEYSYPTGALKINYVVYNIDSDTPKRLIPVTFRKFLEKPKNESNIPVNWAHRPGAQKYYIYPTYTGTMTVYYVPTPTDIADNSNSPDLHPLAHMAIVEKTVQALNELDQKLEEAERYRKFYEQRIMRIERQLRPKGPVYIEDDEGESDSDYL